MLIFYGYVSCFFLPPLPSPPLSSSQYQHWKTSHRDGSSSIKSLPVKCCLPSCVDTVNISIATSFPSNSIVQHFRLVTVKYYSLHFIASSFHFLQASCSYSPSSHLQYLKFIESRNFRYTTINSLSFYINP